MKFDKEDIYAKIIYIYIEREELKHKPSAKGEDRGVTLAKIVGGAIWY